MPAGVLEGSWHSGGYYGHDRSQAHNERAQTYRRLASPAPPNVFLRRSQLPRSTHSFSEHDSRRSLACGPIYFEHNIGKRRSSVLQPRDRNTGNFLTWIPDRNPDRIPDRILDKSRVPVEARCELSKQPVSAYTVDYRGVQLELPQTNQRLLHHLQDSIEDEKLIPISTYRYVHGSLYPELNLKPTPWESAPVVKRSTEIIDVSKPPTTTTWKEVPQDGTISQGYVYSSGSRPRKEAARESVARCLVWYQPPQQKPVTESHTNSVVMEEGKSSISQHVTDGISENTNTSQELVADRVSSDQNIPPIIGL